MRNKYLAIIAVIFIQFSLGACKGGGDDKNVSHNLTSGMRYTYGNISNNEAFNSPQKDKKQLTAWKYVDIDKPAINIKKEGYVCYLAQLPESDFTDPVLFIPAGSYWGSFEIYLENELLYRSADPITLKTSPLFYQPHIIPLPGGSGGKVLFFRFFTRFQGPFGIFDRIYIDSKNSVLEEIVHDQLDRLILGTIFIFVGLISLVIFLIKLRARIYTALSLFLMSFSFGLYIVFSSDISIIFFTTAEFANNVTFMSILFFPVGLFSLIDQTVSPGWKNFIRKSWQFFLLISIPAIVIFLTGLRISMPITLFIFIRTIIIAVTFTIALIHVVFYIFKGSWTARIISIGLLIFGISVISDILFRLKKVDNIILYYHWGFLILLLALGYVLFRIFDNSRIKLKLYSEELSEKSEILQELNRTLEEKVQERTEELNLTNIKITRQNEILAHRNRTIEKEIVMARSIQQQLIPESSPFEHISSLYRPMDLVGGDFYDFIMFDDSDKTGIFISDVSGHGIAAAFITSMLKTIILQAGNLREDPARLLTYLNEILYGKTAENFITAFYCIINTADNSMVYSNAGHNSPYMIINGKPVQIGGKRNVPIAILDNNEMEERKKFYENSYLDLDGVSKIILYTDGLTEAVNVDTGGDYFEDAGMMDILEQYHQHSSGDLIDILFSRLTDYRGSEHFEDDVCIICIDL